MIYTNITGKFIGECMTGFGIHYPIHIVNSGNSEVFYSFESDDTNFTVSTSNLKISNGNSGLLDIYFYPTITNVSGLESGIITIASESSEDGSVDPSGNISIYITGHRLVDTTGGHIRNFRALRNYDGEKGLSYSFYWRPPTGIDYLNNYFITGYQLEIATANTFSPANIIVSKVYEIPQNNYDPRYATYYGYPDEDIFTTIDKYDDSTKFNLDTPYYARIYTWVDGVTGESVFATGIDSYNTDVSNEVLTGNVTVKNNIVFSKKALDFYIPPKIKYINYNLYEQIVAQNNNNNNFRYISGINIYFPGDTIFSSASNNEYCLNLKGLLKNFTGDSTYGTNINFYLENTTKILSYEGAGGKLEGVINSNNTNISPKDYIQNIESKYNNSKTCTPPKNGGSIFDFEITSTKSNNESITDINYNIYKKFGAEIKAGGGGSKASLIVKYPSNKGCYIGYDKNNNVYNTLFYLNGNLNDKSITQINVNTTSAQPDAIIKKDQILSTISTSSSVGFLSTWPSIYGEDAERNGGYFKLNKPIQTNNGEYVSLADSVENDVDKSIDLKTVLWETESLNPISYTINKTSNILCGKFLDGFSNIKTKFYPYRYDVPSNFIFRFDNSGISNSPNVKWADTTNTAILQGSTDVGIYNNSLYSHVGKNSITLHNQQYLQYTFSSVSNAGMVKKKCDEFDLYMVLAYAPVNKWNDISMLPYKNSKFKFLDWSLNSSNTIAKQVLIKSYPIWNEVRLYRKESNVFEFLLAPLINSKFEYQNIDVSQAAWNNSYVKLWDSGPFGAGFDNKYALIGKSLFNATDYYPMIVNIKRSGVVYSVFINNQLIISYDMGSFIQNASAYILSNVDATILKLISDCTQTNGSNEESVSYFDIVFYNKILNSDENLQINSYFINEYFKLFSGGTSDYLDLKSNRVRLPNVFNLAGRNLV